jgi:cytochrome c oxidase cbb3-type subunit 3
MKFIHYLESIAGISIYPLISLVLFTGIFSVVLIKTFTTSKETIDELKKIPIE